MSFTASSYKKSFFISNYILLEIDQFLSQTFFTKIITYKIIQIFNYMF